MCCIDKIVEEIYIGKGYCYDQTFYNRGGEDSFRRESCYVKLPMNVYFERNLENSLDRVPFQMAVYAARKRISFNFDHICITIPLPRKLQAMLSNYRERSTPIFLHFSSLSLIPFSLSFRNIIILNLCTCIRLFFFVFEDNFLPRQS